MFGLIRNFFNLDLNQYFSKFTWVDPEPIDEIEGQPEEEPEKELNHESIKGILGTLDDVYTNALKRHKAFGMSAECLNTLKAYGATVFPDNFKYSVWGDDLVKIKTKRRPAVIYLTNLSFDQEGDLIEPESFFAIKRQKFGLDDCYDVGIMIKPSEDGGTKWRRTNIWECYRIRVSPDGEIKIPKEKAYGFANITTSDPHGRDGRFYKGKGNRKTVENHSWVEQDFIQMVASDERNKDRSIKEIKARLGWHVAFCFALWEERFDYWRVSCKRKGQLNHILINQQDPKILFKDRTVVARTKTGQKKKILHYVTGHLRTLRNGRVKWIKPHLRGLKSFPWDEYECNIVAPDFHRINVDEFEAGSYDYEVEGDDVLVGEDAMDMLADMEGK